MHKNKLDYIKEVLIGIKTKVDIDSSLKQYDINIKSEVIFMHLLNDIYGWKLVDANEIKDNFKAIDLIDNINKYVIQVTSNISNEKVYESIKKFAEFRNDDFYKAYADYKLKIFYIDVDVKFSKTILNKFEEGNIYKDDLLSISHILREANKPVTCDKLHSTIKYLFDSSKMLDSINMRDVTGVGTVSGGTVNQNITINLPQKKEVSIKPLHESKELQKELEEYLETKNESTLLKTTIRKFCNFSFSTSQINLTKNI